MIVYYLSFSDRPDVVIQNGSMMNIHENKQLTLTCSYDCLPPMEKIVWFKINDKGNFTLDENKHTLVLSVINRLGQNQSILVIPIIPAIFIYIRLCIMPDILLIYKWYSINALIFFSLILLLFTFYHLLHLSYI